MPQPDEARKDRIARAAMIAALREKLKSGAGLLIGNSGYRRYLKVDSGSETIDAKKVAQEGNYDGKWMFQTTTDLPNDAVALQYKNLWMVESVFRAAKDTLETRPVFHKCDSTILGHVFAAFLALVLLHELKPRIDFPAAWDEVGADLDALYEVGAESDERTLGSPQGTCGNLLKAVGLAIPPAAVEVGRGAVPSHFPTPQKWFYERIFENQLEKMRLAIWTGRYLTWRNREHSARACRLARFRCIKSEMHK